MIPVADLRVGSVVRLISGSPKMTVAAIRGAATGPQNSQIRVSPAVDLVWYGDRQGLQRATLSPDLLTWPRNLSPDLEEGE